MPIDYNIEYADQKDLRYSEEAKNAVRYGYQYRSASTSEVSCFIVLPELPGVFYWLAGVIIQGIAYDAFKLLVQKTLESLKRKRKHVNPIIKKHLSTPDDIRQFYDYVKEYKNKVMNVSSKEIEQIKEGIIADYTKKKAEKIYLSKKRFPSSEEYAIIRDEAYRAADLIMADRVQQKR